MTQSQHTPGQRREFEMSQEQLNKLLDACKPTPVMYLSGGIPMHNTQQENANDAWCELGQEMGFDGMSVEPSNKGPLFFSAIAKARGEK